jgi:photosystem II stability/assembly factor-like uncharacterized protein
MINNCDGGSMSKRVSLFLIPFLSLFVLGMRDCGFFVANFVGDLTHAAYGNLFPEENGRPGRVVSSEPAGVVVGDSGRIYSTRGRPPSPWILRNSGTTQRLNFAAFYPFDTALVYAVGNGGTILRSTNAGVDWVQLSSGTTRNLNALSISNRTGAFAVGDSGVIRWTTNTGNTWLPRTSGTTGRLRCVYAINDIFILAAGEKGTILRSSNGGLTWTSRFFDTTKTFNKIAASRNGVMWAVGNGGAIYTSITYGDTWTPQASTTTQNLNDVYFADATTGVAVGDNGTVRNTTNGGVTWLTDAYLNSLTIEHIKSIAPVHFSTLQQQSAVDSITVVGIVGNRIMTVSSEPLTQVFEPSPSLPSDFALHQNYPNPFNPTTRIGFRISEVGFVSLKVFDLAGHEVATLVKEKLAPGDHERSFDGAGLSSGIYFYQLTAGSRTEVKKLVLLK